MDNVRYPQEGVDSVDNLLNTLVLQTMLGAFKFGREYRRVKTGFLTGLGDKVWTTFKLFTGVDKSVDNL